MDSDFQAKFGDLYSRVVDTYLDWFDTHSELIIEWFDCIQI